MRSHRRPHDARNRALELLIRVDDWISAHDLVAWSLLCLLLTLAITALYIYFKKGAH